jgi:hypothetical protein
VYTYEPETVPLPFPKKVIRTIRVPKSGHPESADLQKYGEDKIVLRLAVSELELAERSDRVVPEAFRPSQAWLGTNYHHHIITNGKVFEVRGTNLVPLTASQNRSNGHYSGTQAPRRWVVVLVLVSLCLLPVILLAIQTKKQLIDKNIRSNQ